MIFNKFLGYIILCIFLINITNCAMIHNNNSMKGYVAASNELTQLAKQYEWHYNNANETTKNKWKNEIDPLFLQTYDILQNWESLLDLSMDTSDVQNQYFMMRTLILKYLVEIQEE